MTSVTLAELSPRFLDLRYESRPKGQFYWLCNTELAADALRQYCNQCDASKGPIKLYVEHCEELLRLVRESKGILRARRSDLWFIRGDGYVRAVLRHEW